MRSVFLSVKTALMSESNVTPRASAWRSPESVLAVNRAISGHDPPMRSARTSNGRQLSAARSLSSSGIAALEVTIKSAWSLTHLATFPRNSWKRCCRVSLVTRSLGNLRRKLITIERSAIVPGSREIDATAFGAHVENWRGS